MKIYGDINFQNLFDSKLATLVFNNNGNDGTSKSIRAGIIQILEGYHSREFIFFYDMQEWLKQIYKAEDDKDDYTGFSSDSEYVEKGVLKTHISEIKEKLYKGEDFYIQEIDEKKLINTDFFKNIPESMFFSNFHIIIQKNILVYGHLDYGFGFIDITGKNGDLMRELLQEFVEIPGLTWYANSLGKSYIQENNLNIKLEE